MMIILFQTSHGLNFSHSILQINQIFSCMSVVQTTVSVFLCWSLWPRTTPKYSQILWSRENSKLRSKLTQKIQCLRASVVLIIIEGGRISMGDCGFPSHCDDFWARTSMIRSYCPQWKREIHKHLRVAVHQCYAVYLEIFSYKTVKKDFFDLF